MKSEKHPCPNCGEMTHGFWDPGGRWWEICDICGELGSECAGNRTVKCPDCGKPAPSWAAECDACGCVWD